MGKFDIYNHCYEDETYSSVDLREELRKRLNLNIIGEDIFNKVIAVFESGDMEKINKLTKGL